MASTTRQTSVCFSWSVLWASEILYRSSRTIHCPIKASESFASKADRTFDLPEWYIKTYCNQTLWFDSTKGIFKPLKENVSDCSISVLWRKCLPKNVLNGSQATLYNLGCCGYPAHPPTTRVRLPNTANYIGRTKSLDLLGQVTEPSFMTAKTRLQASCTSHFAICSVLTDWQEHMENEVCEC